jgi:hypothetical protein
MEIPSVDYNSLILLLQIMRDDVECMASAADAAFPILSVSSLAYQMTLLRMMQAQKLHAQERIGEVPVLSRLVIPTRMAMKMMMRTTSF